MKKIVTTVLMVFYMWGCTCSFAYAKVPVPVVNKDLPVAISGNSKLPPFIAKKKRQGFDTRFRNRR